MHNSTAQILLDNLDEDGCLTMTSNGMPIPLTAIWMLWQEGETLTSHNTGSAKEALGEQPEYPADPTGVDCWERYEGIED